ncbi:hypothetical protein C8Q79DRAFT_989574 [Trametes meyenii]|nr:hypothetical protein C8Q79DRAFT_989574 [Trametes meyenii]
MTKGDIPSSYACSPRPRQPASLEWAEHPYTCAPGPPVSFILVVKKNATVFADALAIFHRSLGSPASPILRLQSGRTPHTQNPPSLPHAFPSCAFTALGSDARSPHPGRSFAPDSQYGARARVPI